jgi:hypothetical protein
MVPNGATVPKFRFLPRQTTSLVPIAVTVLAFPNWCNSLQGTTPVAGWSCHAVVLVLSVQEVVGHPEVLGLARAGFGPRVDRRSRGRLQLEALEDRTLPAATVQGTVFVDYNANGVQDVGPTLNNAGQGTVGVANDNGVAGVTVTVYNAAGTVVGTATTAANGASSITDPAGSAATPYRVEFTNLLAGFTDGPEGRVRIPRSNWSLARRPTSTWESSAPATTPRRRTPRSTVRSTAPATPTCRVRSTKETGRLIPPARTPTPRPWSALTTPPAPWTPT